MKVKLSPYVCYRYESKIYGGKTFIFQLDYGKIYISDYDAYRILEFIDFCHPEIDNLCSKFSSLDIQTFIRTMEQREVISYEC